MVEGLQLPDVYKPDPSQPCVEWTGRVLTATPVIRVRGTDYSVARIIISRLTGAEVPASARLRKTCGNPRCVSPHHHTFTPRGRSRPKSTTALEPAPAVDVGGPLDPRLVDKLASSLGPVETWTASLARDPTAPCVQWPGRLRPLPTLADRGTTYSAVRLVAGVLSGHAIGENTRFRNGCGNPLCVNPAHYEMFAYAHRQKTGPREPDTALVQAQELAVFDEDTVEIIREKIDLGKVKAPADILNMYSGMFSPRQAEELFVLATRKESANYGL
jgi:hypothetical protein